jgi:predicted N-acetyltransferase YhbS
MSDDVPPTSRAAKLSWWPALQRLLCAHTSLEAQLYPPLAMDVKFRPYDPNDFESCLAIYVKNESGRFPHGQRQKFERYLRKEKKTLIIAERKSRVVGYGGIDVVAPNVAFLCYGIIEPEFQGQRIGSTLTLLRIAQLESQPSGAFVFIRAVDASMPVYRQFGFIENARWKADDGTDHPAAFLHIPVNSLERVKSKLRRRNLTVQGKFVLHTSEVLSCDIKLVGGRYRCQIQPQADGTTAPDKPMPLS